MLLQMCFNCFYSTSHSVCCSTYSRVFIVWFFIYFAVQGFPVKSREEAFVFPIENTSVFLQWRHSKRHRLLHIQTYKTKQELGVSRRCCSEASTGKREKRDALSDEYYEEYYEEGEDYENGKPKKRKRTPKELADSIDWHIQLVLIIAIIFIITCWLWLYCCLFPIIECTGYWIDKKKKRDPKYRIVKRVGRHTRMKAPTYENYLKLKEEYDQTLPEGKTFNPEAFLLFCKKRQVDEIEDEISKKSKRKGLFRKKAKPDDISDGAKRKRKGSSRKKRKAPESQESPKRGPFRKRRKTSDAKDDAKEPLLQEPAENVDKPKMRKHRSKRSPRRKKRKTTDSQS